MIPDLVCPCIIMRHGGLDGVALQKEEYFGLLQRLEIGMHGHSAQPSSLILSSSTAQRSRAVPFFVGGVSSSLVVMQ